MAGHPAHLQHICYFRGEFMPLEAANVNLSTHALQYGTGVFEGIRAYWNPRQEQLFGLFVLEHFERMARNCRLLRIALPHSPEELTAITRELLARNAYRGNIYIRPIAFKADYKIGLVLTDVADGFGIYTLPMGDYLDTAKGLHCCVSSWQRPDDNAIPARGKLTGSYINACLAADDARLAGYDDTIMLTIDGHVAEGSSCNLFMVRGGGRRRARPHHRPHPGPVLRRRHRRGAPLPPLADPGLRARGPERLHCKKRKVKIPLGSARRHPGEQRALRCRAGAADHQGAGQEGRPVHLH